jgi:hypothetical protein
MNSDVIEHRAEWIGEPERWYSAIPDYPQWIAVDTVYDAGYGRRLSSPTYYTHYCGRDYACGQRVEFEDGIHVAVPVVQVFALERVDDNDLPPGWWWDPLLHVTCPDDRLPSECLARIRRQLPELILQKKRQD